MSLTVPLTPARRLILAAGVPAVLALLAGLIFWWGRAAVSVLANGDPAGYSVRVSAPVTGGQTRLSVGSASLSVRAGRARLVQVSGRLTGTIARPEFQERATPDGLALGSQCLVPVGNCAISLTARVPAGLPLTVTDGFGDLTTSHLAGQITLTDYSGTLSATGLAGTIRLTDQFGSVLARDLSGGIRLINSNGDITAAGVTGGTRLQDSFGNITVTGLAASDVSATDSSGNIVLIFTRVPRHVVVRDSFGNVTLELPAGPASYRVDAPVPSFGRRTVTVPTSATSGNVISVHNSNGNITITNGPPG